MTENAFVPSYELSDPYSNKSVLPYGLSISLYRQDSIFKIVLQKHTLVFYDPLKASIDPAP